MAANDRRRWKFVSEEEACSSNLPPVLLRISYLHKVR